MMKSPLLAFSRKKTAACFAGAVMLAMATPALAQSAPDSSQDDDWKVGLGVGVLNGPIFPGSSESQLRPAPYLSISYRDRFFVRGPVAGVNLFHFGQDDRFRVGMMMRITPEAEWDESDDRALRPLGHITAGADLGIFASYRSKSWFAELAATRGAVLREEAHERTTRASGMAVELGVGYAARFTPKLRWMAQANVSWADATRTRTYFGINEAQSVATGLTPYEPKAGIASYGLTTSLDYAFGKHWSVLGLVRFARLAGDSKDSPIVVNRGKTNQLYTGVFLGYRF